MPLSLFPKSNGPRDRRFATPGEFLLTWLGFAVAFSLAYAGLRHWTRASGGELVQSERAGRSGRVPSEAAAPALKIRSAVS